MQILTLTVIQSKAAYKLAIQLQTCVSNITFTWLLLVCRWILPDFGRLLWECWSINDWNSLCTARWQLQPIWKLCPDWCIHSTWIFLGLPAEQIWKRCPRQTDTRMWVVLPHIEWFPITWLQHKQFTSVSLIELDIGHVHPIHQEPCIHPLILCAHASKTPLETHSHKHTAKEPKWMQRQSDEFSKFNVHAWACLNLDDILLW